LWLAVEPIRSRLKVPCHIAKQNTERDPDQADQVTRRLLEQAKTQLDVLDRLSPEGKPARDAGHHELANTALQCTITLGNDSGETFQFSVLAGLILQIAAGTPVKASEHFRAPFLASMRENRVRQQ
jgi:hypothetical protein